MSRSPQHTLLPGLGVACAVLAGVLVAFNLAFKLVGVELPLGDSPRGPASALEIQARSDAADGARRRARAARVEDARQVGARTAPPAGEPAATPTATARVDASPALAVERDPQPEHVTAPVPPPPPARAAGSPGATGAGAATASAQPRPRNPLEPLGSGVNDTTDGVANTLRTLTDKLGDSVAPLSPELGGVLANTGDALGDVVEGTGNLLGQVLGRPAGRR
ncbi:MAG: hypothetical protein QOJ89_1292 [bacterium]|jgi:hypothetical protein